MELQPYGDEAPSVELLTAALRADRSDLDTFVEVLTTTLADALPPEMVSVQMERSLADRLAKRPGRTVSITVRSGDKELTLAASQRGSLEAQLSQQVRGVVISRKPISVAEWTELLAEQLADAAQRNTQARAALERLLGA